MMLLFRQTYQPTILIIIVSLCLVFFAITKFILLVLNILWIILPLTMIIILLSLVGALVGFYICYKNRKKRGMLIKLKCIHVHLYFIFHLHCREHESEC